MRDQRNKNLRSMSIEDRAAHLHRHGIVLPAPAEQMTEDQWRSVSRKHDDQHRFVRTDHGHRSALLADVWVPARATV